MDNTDDKDLKGFYEERVASLRDGISRRRRRNRLFLFSELATFIAAVAFIAAYTVYGGIQMPAAAAVMAVCYVAARRADVLNSERTERLAALCSVYENELSYLRGEFSPFDDGRRYADPAHPFTYDMDVFGPQSLFHRINRTVTTGGSDELARRLSTLPGDTVADTRHDDTYETGHDSPAAASLSHTIAYIEEQRQTIDRLAAMETLRTDFIACGHGGRIDTQAMLTALDKVRQTPMPRYALSGAALAAAGVALAGFFATILLSVFTPLTPGVPVLWGTLQLFAVLMLTNGPLHAIMKSAGRLQREAKAYKELAEIIARETDNGPDQNAFHKFDRIISALDRRGNVLGLVLFDVFLLSDFFLVRRFFRWRRDYIETVGEWIATVSRTDALVSMATFRYNEPLAGHAEITDSEDIVCECRGMWHPFLGAGAVHNDFTIADSHYYIVTGANMAGKSTFLRSLGVNYILAVNGMPVFAGRLRVSLFSLFSSMRTTDDLSRGISYFNAELLRLKQLIGHCRSRRRTLIILDEILKGTNSLDKLNGSRMFLDAISRLPVSGVIATHDLELSRMEETPGGRFHNFCFEIGLSDKITYTYKITPGVARNQNATFLLHGIISEMMP